MKIVAITITTISLLATWLSFNAESEAEYGQLSAATVAQISPTPRKKADDSLPVLECSPQPMPISEEDKNNPVREQTSSDRLNAVGGTTDWDCDGICNVADNCIFVYNPDQKDGNGDGKGNACDPKSIDPSFQDSRCDGDGDGITDQKDNCPLVCNPDQKFVDINENNVNDLCDSLSPNFVPEKMCAKRLKVRVPKPPRPAKVSSKENKVPIIDHKSNRE